MTDHLFKRNQAFAQFGKELFLLLKPLIETSPAKLPLLKSQILQSLRRWDEFTEISVIQLERDRLNFIFNIELAKFVYTVQLVVEEAQLQFSFEVFGNDLRIIIRFKEHVRAVLQHRHLVVPLPGQTPNSGPIV